MAIIEGEQCPLLNYFEYATLVLEVEYILLVGVDTLKLTSGSMEVRELRHSICPATAICLSHGALGPPALGLSVSLSLPLLA